MPQATLPRSVSSLAASPSVGKRRQAHVHGERKTDVVLMDILAEEFESPFVLPTIDRTMGRA